MFYNLEEIKTPALVICKQKLLRNIDRAAGYSRKHGLKLRPHFKTHKSIAIAELQRGKGIDGITVATLSEAMVFAEAGFDSVFISRIIAEKQKLDPLLKLAENRDIIIAADDIEVIKMIDRYFSSAGRKIKIRIEIDSGQHRCGVSPEEAPDLIKRVCRMRGISFNGIFTHAGQVYGSGKKKREKIAGDEAGALIKVFKALKKENIPCPVLSTGTTPTFEFMHLYPEINEIRPGNYVFFDEMQHQLGVCEREEISLFVYAAVISRPASDRVIINAGAKALGLDKGAHGREALKGYGKLVDFEGEITALSEEHGIVSVPAGSPLRPGDKIKILPNHACSTVNLYDAIWLLNEKGYIENRFKVDARGKSW
jgi:D-serine deaminase-like pyridoxal phosphate-dependent protein